MAYVTTFTTDGSVDPLVQSLLTLLAGDTETIAVLVEGFATGDTIASVKLYAKLDSTDTDADPDTVVLTGVLTTPERDPNARLVTFTASSANTIRLTLGRVYRVEVVMTRSAVVYTRTVMLGFIAAAYPGNEVVAPSDEAVLRAAGDATVTTLINAKLASLTGVTDRTTIGGTATAPTVDIAAAYVGQTSITKLGTVTTGTWNGTTRMTSTVAGESLRLGYSATMFAAFSVTSLGGLTITPQSGQAVTVSKFAATSNATFDAQTLVGDLFRVESIAAADTTGLTGGGLEVYYDPTDKATLRSYDYTAGALTQMRLVASLVQVTAASGFQVLTGGITSSAGANVFVDTTELRDTLTIKAHAAPAYYTTLSQNAGPFVIDTYPNGASAFLFRVSGVTVANIATDGTFSATFGAITAPRITIGGTAYASGTFSASVLGEAAADRSVFRAGIAGLGNGFSVSYVGGVMVYAMTNGGLTVANNLTVSAGGIIVTGSSSVAGTFTATTVVGTTLTGLLSTPAQTNVTTLGTLTALRVSGGPDADSLLNIGEASGAPTAPRTAALRINVPSTGAGANNGSALVRYHRNGGNGWEVGLDVTVSGIKTADTNYGFLSNVNDGVTPNVYVVAFTATGQVRAANGFFASAGGLAVTGASTLTGSLTVSTSFGCNGSAAQAAFAVGAAATDAATTQALANFLRTALLNNGIAKVS